MAICDHEEKLISKLEGVFYRNIYNNGKQIRYPISFNDGGDLRGSNTILRVDDMKIEKFYSGRYKFGANSVYIYEAIKDILDELEKLNVIEGDWRDEAIYIFEEDE